MSASFQNAKLILHGWSKYTLIREAELINNAGELVCPYCGATDKYRVIATHVEPDLRGNKLTECLRTTCCDHKIAVTVFVPEGGLDVLS